MVGADASAACARPANSDGNDHVSFIRGAAVPAFNAVQDYDLYDTRVHHTNMDTFERVKEQDLKQSAIVLASFAYHAAMRAEKIPSGAAK